MKKTYTLALAGAGLLTLAMGGNALAFHGGGVAHCDGCHSMHNSADNPRAGSAMSNDLMKGSDASSTCLNCHNGNGGYHIASTVGSNVSQGGDFFWVSTDGTYTYYSRGERTSLGDNHGHNIVAADFGFAADATNTTAPGGSMAANTLGCTSCHDPHGQVNGGTSAGTAAISVSGSYGAADPTDGSIHGNFRLLGDAGYKQINVAAPVATADGSNGKFVNYGTGMSGWCLSCHGAFNDNANMHPTNVAVPAVYNSYKKTGDFTGTVDTAFDSLVPFERGVDDGSLLAYNSTMGVEDGNDVVMCLSCHRAHASAFDNALRWDGYSSEYIAESAILQDYDGKMTAGAVPYYAGGVAVDVVATYGEYQRSLCNKCHAKD
jgi:hypothetical protein